MSHTSHGCIFTTKSNQEKVWIQELQAIHGLSSKLIELHAASSLFAGGFGINNHSGA
jgi:hypothetical protein